MIVLFQIRRTLNCNIYSKTKIEEKEYVVGAAFLKECVFFQKKLCFEKNASSLNNDRNKINQENSNNNSLQSDNDKPASSEPRNRTYRRRIGN